MGLFSLSQKALESRGLWYKLWSESKAQETRAPMSKGRTWMSELQDLIHPPVAFLFYLGPWGLDDGHMLW